MAKKRAEDDYVTLKIHRNVMKTFSRAVEDWFGKRRGYIGDTAEEALKEKTTELLAKIEQRDGKG